jgi:hypothetical protein
MIVVDDTSSSSISRQFITVPFRLLLTGLITNLDVTGILLLVEKLNIIELIVNWNIAELEERSNSVAVVSSPRITLNLHSSKSPVVVHVNSS